MDTDYYGYCVDDPVNCIDPYGLEPEESNDEVDPAKDAGRAIVGRGVLRALREGWKGNKIAGAAGAASRFFPGLSTGMLLGTVLEIPQVQDAINGTTNWILENAQPQTDGTMLD